MLCAHCPTPTYVQREATLGSPETRMEPSAAKDTTSNVCKVLRIIMEKRLANKQATPAMHRVRLESRPLKPHKTSKNVNVITVLLHAVSE